MKKILKKDLPADQDKEIHKLVSLGNVPGGNCTDGYCAVPETICAEPNLSVKKNREQN